MITLEKRESVNRIHWKVHVESEFILMQLINKYHVNYCNQAWWESGGLSTENLPITGVIHNFVEQEPKIPPHELEWGSSYMAITP